jgi:hypothetical protein
VPPGTESCEVSVVYGYTVENIGNKCEPITSVVATIDKTKDSRIPVSDWQFCPGQTKALTDERDQEDLCAMAGNEIGFELALNNDDGFLGEALYVVPTPATITPPS